MMRLEPELDERIIAAAQRAGQSKTAWVETACEIRLAMDAATENEQRSAVELDEPGTTEVGT